MTRPPTHPSRSTHADVTTSLGTIAADPPPGRARAALHTATGLLGGLLGLLPHVLHHVAFLAGTAVVAGSGGTALFGALGLAASVPLLVRLHRRFHSWRPPAIGLTVFVAMFAVSAFVIGPAISGTGGNAPTVTDHTNHH